MDKIKKSDDEIVKKIEATSHDPEQFYRLNNERLQLYTQAEKMPVDDITRVFFSLTKSNIRRDVALFKIKKDFDEQVSQIISRLDDIENNIGTIKNEQTKHP